VRLIGFSVRDFTLQECQAFVGCTYSDALNRRHGCEAARQAVIQLDHRSSDVKRQFQLLHTSLQRLPTAPEFRSFLKGHVVRSLSEKNIDDYLFRENIVHAYERPVNTRFGELISDFYIPAGAQQGSHAVYIEFWGMLWWQ